jgi:NTP pyrophosphatase (non-canonical NTP hydrolase)
VRAAQHSWSSAVPEGAGRRNGEFEIVAHGPRLPVNVPSVGDERVMGALNEFVRERDWAQFHTPQNLAKSISIEAGELLECFQWSEDGDLDAVGEELADVLTYCLLLAQRLGVDPDDLVLAKLARTRVKYPVEASRGRSARYDLL